MSYPRRITTSGPAAVAQRMQAQEKRLRQLERGVSHAQQRGTAFDPSSLTIVRDSLDVGEEQPPNFTSGPFVDVWIPEKDSLVAIYMQFEADGTWSTSPGASTMLHVGVEDVEDIFGFAFRGMIPLLLVDDNLSNASGTTGVAATGSGTTFGTSPSLWRTGREGYAHPAFGHAKIVSTRAAGPRRFTMSYYWASGIFTDNPTLAIKNRMIQVTVL